jgi:hypothetical protein
MSLFMCTECGSVENTALSNYAVRRAIDKLPPVCSACDPEIGAWHGLFPQLSAVGMALGRDGFLYSPEEFETRQVRHTALDHVLADHEVPKKRPVDAVRDSHG